MPTKYYDLHQANERLAMLTPQVQYSVHTLINEIRRRNIVPYFWFDGYIGTPNYSENVGLADLEIWEISEFKGYLMIETEGALREIEELLLGKEIKITINETLTFPDIIKETGCTSLLSSKGILFDNKIDELKREELPLTLGTLLLLGFKIGFDIKKSNIYFDIKQVEQLLAANTLNKTFKKSRKNLGVSQAKLDAKNAAKVIADRRWQEDIEKRIRIADMAIEVVPLV